MKQTKKMKNLRNKIRKITTYHSDEGTSGYKLSDKEIEQIIEAFKKLLTEEEFKSAITQEAKYGDGTGKVKADYEQVFENLLKGLE